MQVWTRQFFAIFCLISLALPVLAEEKKKKDNLGHVIEPARQYTACVKLVDRDPKEAFETAQIWGAKGGGAAARHCAALALSAQKDYEGAALELEQMVDLLTDGDGPRPADGLAQAANAWLLAGKLDKALDRIEEALILEPNDVVFIEDHIRILAAANRWQSVLEEVQKALTLVEDDADLYVRYAAALRHLNRLDEAKAALGEAFVLDGGSAAGLLEKGLLLEKTGDPVAAKKAWQQTIDRFPDDLAAKAAAEYIERLEDPKRFAPQPPSKKEPAADLTTTQD
jgi:tetratricopeptide (TPR) repeat protein